MPRVKAPQVEKKSKKEEVDPNDYPDQTEYLEAKRKLEKKEE